MCLTDLILVHFGQLLALLYMKFKEKKVTTIIFNFWAIFSRHRFMNENTGVSILKVHNYF